jgi:hypothetical protein
MRSRRHHVPALPEPATALPQEIQHASHQARLEWLMPGATPLTRAITAAILDGHGLLDESSVPRARRTPAAAPGPGPSARR